MGGTGLITDLQETRRDSDILLTYAGYVMWSNVWWAEGPRWSWAGREEENQPSCFTSTGIHWGMKLCGRANAAAFFSSRMVDPNLVIKIKNKICSFWKAPDDGVEKS